MKDNKSVKKYNEEMTAIINLITVAFAPFMIVLFILGIGNSAGVGILLLLTIMACLCFAPKLRKYKSKFTKISKLIEGVSNDINLLICVITCLSLVKCDNFVNVTFGTCTLMILIISALTNYERVYGNKIVVK